MDTAGKNAKKMKRQLKEDQLVSQLTLEEMNLFTGDEQEKFACARLR